MGWALPASIGACVGSDRPVICIDGDGSLLMHLGSIKTVGTFANKNFKYILLNNNCHDSVGGQSTAGFEIDITTIRTEILLFNVKVSLKKIKPKKTLIMGIIK